MKKLALLLLSAGIVTSCAESDSPAAQGADNQIRLTSKVNSYLRGLGDTQLVRGQEISLYVLRPENGQIIYEDKEFKVGDNGVLYRDNPLYYPEQGNVDMIAIHPEQSVNVFRDQAVPWYLYGDFDVNDDQEKDDNYLDSDLMFARVLDQAPTSSAISLGFKHSFSKVQINLTSNGFTLNNLDKVEVNAYTKLDFRVNRDGSVQFSNLRDFDDIKAHGVTPSSTNTLNDVSVIIPPQTLFAGQSFLKIEFKGYDPYFYAFDQEFKFESGKKYTFNVILNGSGGEPHPGKDQISVTSTVQDWEDGGSQDIGLNGDNQSENPGDDDDDDDDDLTQQPSVNAAQRIIGSYIGKSYNGIFNQFDTVTITNGVNDGEKIEIKSNNLQTLTVKPYYFQDSDGDVKIFAEGYLPRFFACNLKVDGKDHLNFYILDQGAIASFGGNKVLR